VAGGYDSAIQMNIEGKRIQAVAQQAQPTSAMRSGSLPGRYRCTLHE
jgi:hypothetical protein